MASKDRGGIWESDYSTVSHSARLLLGGKPVLLLLRSAQNFQDAGSHRDQQGLAVLDGHHEVWVRVAIFRHQRAESTHPTCGVMKQRMYSATLSKEHLKWPLLTAWSSRTLVQSNGSHTLKRSCVSNLRSGVALGRGAPIC